MSVEREEMAERGGGGKREGGAADGPSREIRAKLRRMLVAGILMMLVGAGLGAYYYSLPKADRSDLAYLLFGSLLLFGLLLLLIVGKVYYYWPKPGDPARRTR